MGRGGGDILIYAQSLKASCYVPWNSHLLPGHVAPTVRTQRDIYAGAQLSSPFYPAQDPMPTFGMVFPPQLSLSRIFLIDIPGCVFPWSLVADGENTSQGDSCLGMLGVMAIR